jgi:hypothetical protein
MPYFLSPNQQPQPIVFNEDLYNQLNNLTNTINTVNNTSNQTKTNLMNAVGTIITNYNQFVNQANLSGKAYALVNLPTYTDNVKQILNRYAVSESIDVINQHNEQTINISRAAGFGGKNKADIDFTNDVIEKQQKIAKNYFGGLPVILNDDPKTGKKKGYIDTSNIQKMSKDEVLAALRSYVPNIDKVASPETLSNAIDNYVKAFRSLDPVIRDNAFMTYIQPLIHQALILETQYQSTPEMNNLIKYLSGIIGGV